jgi:hypothetical protein
MNYAKPVTLQEAIRLLHFAWTCPLDIDFQRGCEQIIREMRADRGWPYAAKAHTPQAD